MSLFRICHSLDQYINTYWAIPILGFAQILAIPIHPFIQYRIAQYRLQPINSCPYAVGVDDDPERRSPRYHETCLALENDEESSVAVSKPCSVWWRFLVVQNLEEACRLPVCVQKQ